MRLLPAVLLALVLAAAPAAPAAPAALAAPVQAAPSPPATAVLHPLHVTYARAAVEGSTVLVTVRFFKDDLTDALRTFARRGDDLVLAATPDVDGIAQRYLNARLAVVANGAAVAGRVVGSAEASETWTYSLEYRAARPIWSLRLRNTLLFEVFHDQRNLVKTAVFPSGREQTLFFTDGEDTHTVRL